MCSTENRSCKTMDTIEEHFSTSVTISRIHKKYEWHFKGWHEWQSSLKKNGCVGASRKRDRRMLLCLLTGRLSLSLPLPGRMLSPHCVVCTASPQSNALTHLFLLCFIYLSLMWGFILCFIFTVILLNIIYTETWMLILFMSLPGNWLSLPSYITLKYFWCLHLINSDSQFFFIFHHSLNCHLICIFIFVDIYTKSLCSFIIYAFCSFLVLFCVYSHFKMLPQGLVGSWKAFSNWIIKLYYDDSEHVWSIRLRWTFVTGNKYYLCCWVVIVVVVVSEESWVKF